MLRRLGEAFIGLTKPIVQRIAAAYDIRLERPLHAYGQHPLILEDEPAQARQNIPKSVYFNTRSGRIVIGRDSVFGEDVKLLTGKHMHLHEAQAASVEHHHVPDSGRDILIGRGCYIGSGAIVVGPVVVGDYAVVGAGSVVTKDVAPHSFVAGVPARLVRRLASG